MNPLDSVAFKTEEVKRRASFLHPKIIEILFVMQKWALKRGLPFVVTDSVSTPEEDEILERTSTTHQQGRGFDISRRGWEMIQIEQFMKFFNRLYSKIAATNKDGESVLVVFHRTKKGAYHFHIQLNRSFAVVGIQDMITKKGNLLT